MSEQISHQPEQHRYVITVDGTEAGFAAYQDAGANRDFDHTVIDGAFGGQGLAGKVVEFALSDSAANGLGIIPTCSYVHKFVIKNPQHLAHVPADVRTRLALPNP
ncbi:GNAT family N-acetyltransferase [Tomitella biformata]|uniref:GNAT family N-acetyltransferase n=1 Tax=Tomitella biformata TaxID=630403 RepID=UPI000466535B|nr:GNAT family N-acetyltransferase [Tomitella biformata]